MRTFAATVKRGSACFLTVDNGVRQLIVILAQAKKNIEIKIGKYRYIREEWIVNLC